MSLTARGPALYTLIFVVAVALVAAFVILIPETENNEIVELRRTAEQGDARAQFNLGYMYYKGKKVSQDYTEALEWFRLRCRTEFRWCSIQPRLYVLQWQGRYPGLF